MNTYLLINLDTGMIRYATLASVEEIAAANARLAALGVRWRYVLAWLAGHFDKL